MENTYNYKTHRTSELNSKNRKFLIVIATIAILLCFGSAYYIATIGGLNKKDAMPVRAKYILEHKSK
ncbi:MAG: hypothetical protein IPP65_07365 [Chlorobi bacterium]|nr:hypothetical protein [Chlorobiota bacterium]